MIASIVHSSECHVQITYIPTTPTIARMELVDSLKPKRSREGHLNLKCEINFYPCIISLCNMIISLQSDCNVSMYSCMHRRNLEIS
ncbi:hypothetical protein V3C99_019192 [Haemonchus contortus]|uniref:Ovule protein n=1 Tax=Haemonchus contortus TaxID=6289 RepID=A0A7I5EDH9_HAECO